MKLFNFKSWDVNYDERLKHSTLFQGPQALLMAIDAAAQLANTKFYYYHATTDHALWDEVIIYSPTHAQIEHGTHFKSTHDIVIVHYNNLSELKDYKGIIYCVCDNVIRDIPNDVLLKFITVGSVQGTKSSVEWIYEGKLNVLDRTMVTRYSEELSALLMAVHERSGFVSFKGVHQDSVTQLLSLEFSGHTFNMIASPVNNTFTVVDATNDIVLFTACNVSADIVSLSLTDTYRLLIDESDAKDVYAYFVKEMQAALKYEIISIRDAVVKCIVDGQTSILDDATTTDWGFSVLINGTIFHIEYDFNVNDIIIEAADGGSPTKLRANGSPLSDKFYAKVREILLNRKLNSDPFVRDLYDIFNTSSNYCLGKCTKTSDGSYRIDITNAICEFHNVFKGIHVYCVPEDKKRFMHIPNVPGQECAALSWLFDDYLHDVIISHANEIGGSCSW